MRFAEARKLKPGTKITFEDKYEGLVILVTERGGVRVQVTDEKPWKGFDSYFRKHGCVARWVHYSQIAA